MNLQRWIAVIAIGVVTPILFTQCDDDNGNTEKGSVNVKMTDAPIDNTNVQGAFVTVSNVKVDGEAVDGFEKQTIDLTAYQQGNAKIMASDEMDVASYNSVSLVLDYSQDASGNSPGCYVLTDDNVRHSLNATSQSQSEIMINDGFDVESGSENNVVIDFDLRKTIQSGNESNNQSEFSFVTDSEMESSLRAVIEAESGSIEGDVNDNSSSDGEMVVYAYNKGEFDADTETQGQGQSNVMFANAVTSAKVDGNGSYTLSFLKEGEYEVHIANYQENSEGEMEFQGMMEASSTTSGQLLGGIMVEADANIQLNILISGLLGK